MIEFRLASHTNVAVYMQLVQQVKQALRLGRLEPGEQLPTVRDVAERLAINPHTVLKAYRELELEGLVRPGGVWVPSCDGRCRAVIGPPGRAGRELMAWVRRARASGWEHEDVVALVETTLRAEFDQGSSGEEIA